MTKEEHMLGNAEIAAIVPVSDVEKAVEFYGGTLGLELQIRRDDLPENREAEFRLGDGSLVVYESVAAGQSKGTLAAFRVADLETVVTGLRERGVAFEEYDLPELKTENGIASIGDLRASWARDPDGNIIAFEQRL
jgi:catechol 2,3-dioxygenase-like lactoylglutathione lyase family enzyme